MVIYWLAVASPALAELEFQILPDEPRPHGPLSCQARILESIACPQAPMESFLPAAAFPSSTARRRMGLLVAMAPIGPRSEQASVVVMAWFMPPQPPLGAT